MEKINQQLFRTFRQYATFYLIAQNTFKGIITTQKDIVENYSKENYEDGYEWNDKKNIHDHCSAIWKDIEEINFNTNIDKIIIADNFTYKLAETKEEATRFAKKYLSDAVRKLKRHWNIVKKIEKNGQGKLLDEKNNILTDIIAFKEYYEVFIHKELEEERDGQ